MVTTIQIDEKVKENLDKLKIHHRETYNELISRLAKIPKKKIDEEILLETIDIISDPETMRDIALGLEEYERGRGIDFDKLKKELKLNVQGNS